MRSACWRIAAASATGTSHERNGAPCQDNWVLKELASGSGPVLLVAVSDGAGSACYSEIGSRLAVDGLVQSAEAFFADGGALSGLERADMCRWMHDIAGSIAATAREGGHEARDYSCTLLAALVGSTHAAFAQIGDGAIVVSNGEDDGWSYVFWPQHGEYANTTNFIQSHDLDTLMEFEVAPCRFRELAIFSDGIENLVLHKAERAVHQRFFRDMMRPLRASAAIGIDEELSDGLRRYLASPVICERTDDDKTLVLATRTEDGAR
jgi:hypothetical protein